MADRMRVLSVRRLQTHLDLLQISERELAHRAGLSHSTVNFLMNGRRRTCTRATAEAMERALGAALGDLFAEYIPPPQSGKQERSR